MVTMPGHGSAPSIQELLAGVGFPVTKEQLVENFQENGASELVLNAIRNSPKTQFTSAGDVMESLRSR